MIPFRSLRMPLCALAFAGVIAAGAGLPAVALDANDRKQVEAIIKEYLIKNPEVLRDAIMELQKREAEAESKQRAAAVKAKPEADLRIRRAGSSSATRTAMSPWSSSSTTTAVTASARSTT